MRVLVTGSRELKDVNIVRNALDELKPTLIIHGNNPRGADTIADLYAQLRGIPCAKMDANWDFYKKGAGPIRNRWMFDLLNPDAVVAFPTEKSVGTRDMIKYAKQKGMEPIVYEC